MKKLIFIIPLCLLAFACKKKGCTDVYADNYVDDAKKNDKSCLYSGSVVFWMDSVTSHHLMNHGFTNVRFQINGDVSGQMNSTSFRIHEPNCYDTACYTLQIGTGSDVSQEVSYSIINASDSVLTIGKVTVQGGQCEKVQFSVN